MHERIFESARLTHPEGMHRLDFSAMATRCRIDFHGESESSSVRSFCEKVLLWVSDFESKYSRFLPNSVISRINDAAGDHWVEIDAETENLLNLCQELYFMTRGAFDPSSLAILKLWDWKSDTPSIPDSDTIERTMATVGWKQVQRRPGAVFIPQKGLGLDFGGIGKEYAVDNVMTLAKEVGIPNLLVDFGQDLRMEGLPPQKPAWHIGLESPHHPGLCWTSLAVSNKAVASSGDYLRHFSINGKRYGHIIDPRSGYPVDNGCRVVTVLAPTCTVAGVLATSAFILGAEEGLSLIEAYYGAEACITTDSKTYESKNFNDYVVS